MNHSQRLLDTLDFKKREDGGAVLETFFPWTLTIERWLTEGLPEKFTPEFIYSSSDDRSRTYFWDLSADSTYEYEQELGLDGVKRMAFRIPYNCFEAQILEETDEYVLKREEDGWQRKYYKKEKTFPVEVRPVITCMEDWELMKEKIEQTETLYCTDEKLKEIYGKYVEGSKKGEFSLRFRLEGFFWTSRHLLGIEEQLIAFYEMPEVIHAINTYTLEKYIYYMDKILDLIQPEVVLLEEDLSGANGPMISPAMFDEFVGAYYKKLIPFLKKKGVKNVFTDTDGDFQLLIPNFLEAGIDGFLPMDVNAGMDIVAVRKSYPTLKFIGGFNKLAIAEGKEAIDREFKRLMPVIRQGGYIPGVDHQAAPSTSFENYLYYIEKLKEAMKYAGADSDR